MCKFRKDGGHQAATAHAPCITLALSEPDLSATPCLQASRRIRNIARFTAGDSLPPHPSQKNATRARTLADSYHAQRVACVASKGEGGRSCARALAPLSSACLSPYVLSATTQGKPESVRAERVEKSGCMQDPRRMNSWWHHGMAFKFRGPSSKQEDTGRGGPCSARHVWRIAARALVARRARISGRKKGAVAGGGCCANSPPLPPCWD